MKRLYVAACLTGFVWVAPHVLTAQAPEGTRAWSSVRADTVRYVEVVDGNVLGGWRTWEESPGIRGYVSERYHGFERSGRLTLDDGGLPVRLESTGQIDDGVPWFERFERTESTARWLTPVARDSATVGEPAFYAAVHPAHDLGVLARALLKNPSRSLPLLPAGEARLETGTEMSIELDGRTRTVRLHAIHGLDLLPSYVWLDDTGATFADEWSILAGWEAAFAELRASVEQALGDHLRTLAGRLAPARGDRPLAIRGARLFDPQSERVRDGTTIVVADGRIADVGADGSIETPAGAEVIDAGGRTVLPGLWDMHAHLRMPAEPDPIFDRGGELLHLAAGVTTARDMGSRVASLVDLRAAVERDHAMGPRILGAGFIDGTDATEDGVGFYVETPEEARAAVDRYAELGFPQIKIHAFLPPDLLPVVVARAKEHGMRVSGHITNDLTTADAVTAGYDEIQHLWWLLWSIPWTNEESLAAGEDWETWHQVLAALTPDSEPVRETIALLAERRIAVDATLGYFVSESSPPEFVADVVDRFPPTVERSLRHRVWQANYFPRSPLGRPARQQALASMFALLPVLHEAGVPLLIGTDVWPGFGLHHEMELFVEAGIPPAEVLALATLGAARVMGMDAELGSIEPGKLADLILVDGDPTADIRDIRRVVTVIKDGRVYDPAAIYRALGIEPCCEPSGAQVPR